MESQLIGVECQVISVFGDSNITQVQVTGLGWVHTSANNADHYFPASVQFLHVIRLTGRVLVCTAAWCLSTYRSNINYINLAKAFKVFDSHCSIFNRYCHTK